MMDRSIITWVLLISLVVGSVAGLAKIMSGGGMPGPEQHRSVRSTFSVRVYPNGRGWGYEIVGQGAVFIRQPFIPVVSGRKPFVSKREALKTGRLVLHKIKSGQRPYVSKGELDSLNITVD